MPRYRYFFIAEPRVHHTGNNLRGLPRVGKFDPLDFLIKELPPIKPSYENISALIHQDRRFKEFKKTHPKSWKIVAAEENVIELKDLILASNRDDSQAGNMLLHLVEGNRKRKEFIGVHYLGDPLPTFITNFKSSNPRMKKGFMKHHLKSLEKARTHW